MGKLSVVKVTLSSGKVVLLREMKISHTEYAAQKVAARSNGDQNLLGLLVQKALVQLLIAKVDGHVPTASELEELDSLLTTGEYGQILKVIGKMSGADDSGKQVAVEMVEDSSS